MKNILAFPLHPESYDEECFGMTLRDYFAAKAMNQIIQQAYELAKACDEEADFSFTATMFPFAKEAYQWADAMMKAREQ